MDLLTTQQASEILEVSPQRVLVLIGNGRLPAIKIGRDWLIAMQDLEKFERRPQGNYKLTAAQIKQIRYMAKEGRTPADLARKFRVSIRTIYRHMNK